MAAHCGTRVWALLAAAGIVLATLRAFVDREPYLNMRRNIMHVGVHIVAVVTTIAVILCGHHGFSGGGAAGAKAWTKS